MAASWCFPHLPPPNFPEFWAKLSTSENFRDFGSFQEISSHRSEKNSVYSFFGVTGDETCGGGCEVIDQHYGGPSTAIEMLQRKWADAQERKLWYDGGAAYWSNITTDNDGVLGGCL